MDAVTHALAASSLFLATGHPELVPFAAVGAVAPDIDILLLRFPQRNPRHYVFTHGGFTHSIVGALLIGCIACALVAVVTVTGPGAGLFGAGFGFAGVLALLVGALTHIGCDVLACPGIPLLYPLSDRKYTAGIFAGPSLFLLVVSVTFIGTLLLSLASPADYRLWAAIFLGYIGVKAAFKLYMAETTDGETIPTANPLRWFVIREEEGSYVIQSRDLLRGRGETWTYPKYRHIHPHEIEQYRDLPEVRRHRYNSYISIVERDGGTITFCDPFRAWGFVRYPFDYVGVEVTPADRLQATPDSMDSPDSEYPG